MAFLTPPQVAQALGVSTSSLKRWCDAGLLVASKTAGGHRRIEIAAVLEFVKNHNHPFKHPELLQAQLPAGDPAVLSLVAGRAEFMRALLAGQESAATAVFVGLRQSGFRLSQLADEIIAPAFAAIGNQWECGAIDVYQERRACEICTRLLHFVRRSIREAPADGPIAVGAAPDQDPYTLPSLLAEMVLCEAGLQATSCGSRLPLASLAKLAIDRQAQLVWVSVSHLDDEPRFLQDFAAFAAELHGQAMIVIGGRALGSAARKQMHYSAFCDQMQQLESLVLSLGKFVPPA